MSSRRYTHHWHLKCNPAIMQPTRAFPIIHFFARIRTLRLNGRRLSRILYRMYKTLYLASRHRRKFLSNLLHRLPLPLLPTRGPWSNNKICSVVRPSVRPTQMIKRLFTLDEGKNLFRSRIAHFIFSLPLFFQSNTSRVFCLRDRVS